MRSVGMPRIMNRKGTSEFSSMFILPTETRPSYSAAIASTVGARRRHGPHHSAQKSTSVTPDLISVSKLLSVNVLTLSDAIVSPWRSRKDLPSSYRARALRHGALIYFDVLTG